MHGGNPYAFSGRLTEAFPSQIVVDVTERCNLACVHCAHSEFTRHPEYAGRDMSEAIHDKLIAEAATDGKGYLRYLRYTAMGEPLLHPLIYAFLTRAKLDSGTVVTLTTNGTLLGENEALRLLDTGVDIVDISIDAFSPDAYRAVRRGGNREKTYRNVCRFLDLRAQRNSPMKIVTSFIEQPLNQGETDPFRTFWLEHGADDVVIRRLHSHAGEKTEISRQLFANESGAQRRPCLYPWERLCLRADGKIGACPSNWNFKDEFADFAATTIREAWQSDFLRQLRQKHLTNCFDDNPCRDCPDWAQTRWPHEGRSYADMVAEMTESESAQNGQGE